MELFNKAKAVKLRSHLDKYLVADDDQQTVRQSQNGTSRKARWTVELVEKPHVVRLKSCHGLYLTATDLSFLLGMTGKKVLQTQATADNISDSKFEWEPIRVDGSQIKLRTWCGMYLRGNGGLPPWRNSVTHDEPLALSTQDWILWEVEAASSEFVPTDSLLSQQSSVSSSFSDELNGSEHGSPMSGGKDDNVEVEKLLTNSTEPHKILSFLSSKADYLVRNNGDQIKVESLKGKKLGFYLSASSSGPCQRFTPLLVKAYNELSPNGDFEIIFLSADEDDESFNAHFSKMPWLAVPFSYKRLNKKAVAEKGVPWLVIYDEDGKGLKENGVEIIQEYGANGYPFTVERIKQLKQLKARRERLKSILVSPSREFVISHDGNKVPVSQLEAKIVGLYFSLSSYSPCIEFTPKLVEVYEKLKAKGESFEIVLIPLGDDEKSFKQEFKKMPGFSLPLNDETCQKLARDFDLKTLPSLVIVGEDGRTLHTNVAEVIEDHGSLAYPFTPEKFAELNEIEKAKEKAQTLESILISGDRNFVIGKGGTKIPVTNLVGKNIILYFSAHWCPPCHAFLPKFIKAYNKIKAEDDAFEVIFISSDRDEASFDEFFSGMPWRALPFGDSRKASLRRTFKIKSIPMLIAIGPSGQTVTKDVRDLIIFPGAVAYPFTQKRMEEVEAEFEKMAKGWPEKLTHALHEQHQLVRARRNYFCDGCNDRGKWWSFYCKECNFDLHPNCALEEEKETKFDVKQELDPNEKAAKYDAKQEQDPNEKAAKYDAKQEQDPEEKAAKYDAKQEQDPEEKATKNDSKKEKDSKGPEKVKYVTGMLAKKFNKSVCDLKQKTGVF